MVAAADALLKSKAIATNTKKFVRSCLAHLPAGAIEPRFSLSDFKGIQLDRTTDHYRRVLFLSRFILASASFSNNSGEHAFPGFLLKVAELFEQYVAKALLEVDGSMSVQVLSQKAVMLDREELVLCKPDLTFITERGTAFIADTKYKDFSTLKFLNEDVYQILAYLIRHRCRDGLLIYPTFNERDVGIVKTIHVPTEIGEIKVHGVCVRLDSPEDVRNQFQAVLPLTKSA
jgi:5-methylcytosine-specific restriction endonuclease McrBC regulatory subunit McrC